jgi:hypothetical protein
MVPAAATAIRSTTPTSDSAVHRMSSAAAATIRGTMSTTDAPTS